MRFWKGEALGNDYLVVAGDAAPSPERVRFLCDRHRGVGADGVLAGDLARDPVALRIFNPDGTEAEKSGNGLRIFGAWLHLRGLAGDATFRVALPRETVELAIEAVEPDGSRRVRVEMGRADFRAAAVHYEAAGEGEEVMGREMEVAGERLAVHLVSMGNPHCVVFDDALDTARFRRLAPRLQADPSFTQGINVQFARVAGPGRLEALVWERGAGETLASGSSACAVAAAARRSGRAEGDRFRVAMPGGALDVDIGAGWAVRLTGPARIVFEGELAVRS